jgi:ABC-type uncharacterized transport system substrate-binding protein
MRRREVLGVLARGRVAASCHAQKQTPVVGFLSSRSPDESTVVVAAFRKGLEEGGFVEGRNVVLEFRWAEGRYGDLPTLATELLAYGATVLFAAGGTPSALAAKAATVAVPVVFSAAPDPVGFGLVDSLSRPGRNVTGMATLTTDLGAKSVEVLKEMLPKAPAKFPWREYPRAGGLMSYGTNHPDSYRRAGVYVGRILKGEKVAELPVMQPDRFELAFNLKTAQSLGLDIPPRLLERADEVTE